MAWTPGSPQLPLTPNKQWLYIAHPYTDNILGDVANEKSLLCYAKAQGYTGLFLYEMNYFKPTTNATTFTSASITKFENFILRAYGYGIEIGAAFGSPSTIEAICNYNLGVSNNPTKSFTVLISELEWWNYSYNLPFQKPGSTGANGEGAYSTYDTVNMFKAYFPNILVAGLKFYTYNGWTKPDQFEYTSGFEIIDTGPDYVTIKGNYTTSGPEIEDNFANGSKLFQANQVIRLENFPVSNQYALYKLDSTNPTTLVAGNTRLKVGAGRIVNGATITSVTGIAGLASGAVTSKWVSTYTDGGGNVISELFLKTSVAHGITPGTSIIYNTVPPFTGLAQQIATARNADNTGTGSPIATGGTTIKVLSPILPIISFIAATGGIAIATCSINHNLQTGDQIQISGISTPAGLVGLKTITVLNATEFQYSVGPAINIAQTAVSGSLQVTTMASQATPRLVTPNGTYQANFPVTGKVRAMLEIVGVDTVSGIPPYKIIKLRGNKLEFVYSTTSLLATPYRTAKVNVSEYNTGSGVTTLVTGGSYPIPSYDAINNVTRVPVVSSFSPSSPKMAGFVEGMANFDIVSLGGVSELELFAGSATVEVFGLHDYVSTPNYGYVSSGLSPRTIQLGQMGTNIKVSWIVSAESAFSAKFFEGKDSNGNLLYSPKTPIDAYKYITIPLVNPSPAQSSPASTETDSGVQSNLYVDGLIVFKDTNIRALNSGDGPNIFVTAGADVTTLINPGSVSLPVTFCDDCLPSGTTYTVTWSIVSQPGGAVITGGTYTTNSCGPATSSNASLNYSQNGTYLLNVTVTESSGGVGVGEDTMLVRVGSTNEPLVLSVINEGSEVDCANNASLAILTATAGNSFGSTTVITFPVTFVWSGPNGYSNTTIDSVGPGATSSLIPPPYVGTYTVTATDSAGRSGTTTYTLDFLYDLSQVFTLVTTSPDCNRGLGSAQVQFTPYAISNNYCSTNYANFIYGWSRGQNPSTFNDPSTSLITAGPITVIIEDCHGCQVVLSGTISQPSALIISLTSPQTANCGSSTGSVQVTASGATPPYSYNWVNSSSTVVGTTATVLNLPADTYTVTVTDDNGCAKSSSVAVQSVGSTFNIYTDDPVYYGCACEEISVTFGVTKLNPSTISGTPPYTFNFSTTPISITYPSGPDYDNGVAVFKFDCGTIAPAQAYQIIINATDSTGCSASVTTSVQVYNPQSPVTGINQVFTPSSPLTSCTGSYLELFVQGGTGVNGSWLRNLIGSPPSIVVSTDINHFNNTGISPEFIDKNWWDTNYPGWNSSTSVTLVWQEFDINNCYSSSFINITPPQTITIEAEITAVPCNSPDPEVGAIDVTVLTGCPPYEFFWTGPGGVTYTDEDITALVTGTYTVEITDDSGNTYTESIFVPVQGPEITGALIGNNCFGGNNSNGYINIDVSGGSGSYTYEWTSANYPNFNETTQDISNLANGTYTVVVTDSYDCDTTENYVIETLSANIDTTVYEPSCWASCDGLILLDKNDISNLSPVTPGGLEIVWYDGSGNILNAFTDEIVAQDLCVGNYQVIVTYGNGCHWVKEFSLGLTYQPTQITSTVIDFIYGDDQSTAAIYINTITGGGGPDYAYSWIGPDGFTSDDRDITGLTKPGNYTVTIYTEKPGSACYITKTFTVKTSCPQFTLDELKVALFKFQCCAGTLAKEYVQLMNVGRPDLSECKLVDLKYLTLVIDAFSCIEELPDPRLSCEDISNIMSQVAKICDCECCSQTGEKLYSVIYNSETGQLDAQGFDKLTPNYPPYTGNGGGSTTVITT